MLLGYIHIQIIKYPAENEPLYCSPKVVIEEMPRPLLKVLSSFRNTLYPLWLDGDSRVQDKSN